MKPPGTLVSYPTQDEDAGLVARMRSGDEQALGILYDRYGDLVRALVLRIVDRPMDAEDVVEEVFWQAWRQAERFDATRGGVGSWLRTIARSRALDSKRALVRAGEVEFADDDGSAAMETPAPSADQMVADAERGEIVRQALLGLPPEQRQALELGYYEGLSQSEIAGRTGIPLGTVKTRMRLALQKLRESLVALGGDVT